MKRRILVLVPLYTPPLDCETIKNYLYRYTWEGTEIDVVGTTENFAVNSRAEMDYALPEVLDLVVKAEKEGYDAVVSYCYNDVGVEASRRLVKIPVIGPFTSSVFFANLLAQRFSVLSTEFPAVKGMKRVPFGPPQSRELGAENYISTSLIPFGKFFVFSGDPEKVRIMTEALTEAGKSAALDGAQALILACTGFLVKLDGLKLPVIDSSVTIKMAEICVDLRKGERPSESGEPAFATRIKVLIPTKGEMKACTIERLRGMVSAGTELVFVTNPNGPATLKTDYDISRTSRFILRETRKANVEGYNAVVVCSFEDHFVESARELSEIPVVGLGAVSMLFALQFSDRFAVVASMGTEVGLRKVLRRNLLEKRLVSLKTVGPSAKKGDYKKALEEAVECAEVVVWGVIDRDEELEFIRGSVDANIIEPLPIAVKVAEALRALNLTHSKVLYPTPALPDYHKERLKKLRNVKKVRERLEPCLFLYEEE